MAYGSGFYDNMSASDYVAGGGVPQQSSWGGGWGKSPFPSPFNTAPDDFGLGNPASPAGGFNITNQVPDIWSLLKGSDPTSMFDFGKAFNFGKFGDVNPTDSMFEFDGQNLDMGNLMGGPGGSRVGGGFLGFGQMDPYQKIGTILGGLQTIAGLGMGLKQLGLAKRAQKFQEKFATANLNNQTSEYNRRISDIGRTRGAVEGTDQSSWVDENRLEKFGK